MATEFWYKEAGTWRKVKEAWYKESATWRKAKEIWFKESGTWRKIFTLGGLTPSMNLHVECTVLNPATATATLTLQPDGTITYVSDTAPSSNWFTPTTSAIGAGFWSYLVVNSGLAPSSGAVATGQQLSSSRSWSWTKSSVGIATANCTMYFYADSLLSVLVGSVTFDVYVESSL
jgi:hypothetical protein